MDVRTTDNLNFDAIPNALRDAVKRFGEVVRSLEEIEAPKDATAEQLLALIEKQNGVIRKVKAVPLPEAPDSSGNVAGVLAGMMKELRRQGNIGGSGVRITNDEGGICLTPEP